MNAQFVDSFIAANGANFAPEQLEQVRAELLNAADDKQAALSAVSFKNPTTMLIIAILLGSYGVDRFMLGEVGLGVAKLLTCGACGIWSIVDWFTAKKRTYEYNYNLLASALA